VLDVQSLIRHLVSTILLVLALSSRSLAQENQEIRKTEALGASTANSLITGRAVYEDTGLPATRHRVQLIASELLSGPHARFGIPTAITNENGEFSLRRVAAGEYYLVARAVDDHTGSRPVFPSLGRSDDRADDVAKVEQFKKDYTRIVIDGQHNLAVNLRVTNPHFGSVSGRVLDSAGMPAVRASLHLMSNGEKTFGASVLSDEQGNYRFLGLPAGEYIISASPPVKEPEDAAPGRHYEGVLGATFFPSTLESRNSPPVTVFADRDTGNIEVKLIARSLHSLAGTVLMRGDNRPVSRAAVRLTRNDNSAQVSGWSKSPDIEGAMSIYTSSTDKSGHWWIANVPDGVYRLRIQADSGDLTDQQFSAEEQNVTVEGADIADLLVEVSEGNRLSGVVSVEGDSAKLQFINVDAARYKGNAVSHVRLDAVGTFALTAVPAGEITLSAFPSPPDKFYVKSIEANGVDLLRTNLTIAEGEEIKDVRIVISPNVGVVTGRVLSQKGDKPIAGINVLLRRVTDDKLRLFGGKLMTTTDDQGNFMLSAAPGVYLVLAWRAAEGPSAFGNSMDKALREQGSGLSLLPSDRKQLDIRMP
jgi:hypothetical protein